MFIEKVESYIEDCVAIDVDIGVKKYIAENKTKECFGNMISQLRDQGFMIAQQHSIGENLFATLRCDDFDLAVAYFNYNHTISLIIDHLNGRKTPQLSQGDYDKLTTPKLGYMALQSPEAVKEGNGMGFVFTLSDGSFIIYDGGYYGDAEYLLRYLEENNVREEKPRVAAWVLTHSHGDHYFAMKQMANVYADRITVEDFVVNARAKAYEFEQYDGYLGELFAKDAMLKFEGAKLVKPHIGQKLWYRDACIEILSTQEEILPGHFRWLNETSIISRVFLGGQSIFMPADSELGVEVFIPTLYGDALKSDFIQQAHHGFSGGSYVLYDLVRPQVAFWTNNGEKFDKYCHPQYNNGYNYYLKNMVKENYNYGNGSITLELPYKVEE